MKKILLILLCLFSFTSTFAKEISFDGQTVTVRKEPTGTDGGGDDDGGGDILFPGGPAPK